MTKAGSWIAASGTSVIAASNDWMSRSTDGGTWNSVRGNGLDLDYPDVHAFAMGDDGIMIAGTSGIQGGYIYGTVDGGDSWLQLGRPRGMADVMALAVLSGDVFIASVWEESRLIRSTDQTEGYKRLDLR